MRGWVGSRCNCLESGGNIVYLESGLIIAGASQAPVVIFLYRNFPIRKNLRIICSRILLNERIILNRALQFFTIHSALSVVRNTNIAAENLMLVRSGGNAQKK